MKAADIWLPFFPLLTELNFCYFPRFHAAADEVKCSCSSR